MTHRWPASRLEDQPGRPPRGPRAHPSARARFVRVRGETVADARPRSGVRADRRPSTLAASEVRAARPLHHPGVRNRGRRRRRGSGKKRREVAGWRGRIDSSCPCPRHVACHAPAGIVGSLFPKANVGPGAARGSQWTAKTSRSGVLRENFFPPPNPVLICCKAHLALGFLKSLRVCFLGRSGFRSGRFCGLDGSA